ncbi:HVO_A0556 family zinc finger protein [Natrinema gelatinilyticum]|uniref:HVO_A0556 family zinc finger protein n=1 Tax=Natrinema gelatinilyticum TaxID=2961571 RepID=UPI0030F4251A
MSQLRMQGVEKVDDGDKLVEKLVGQTCAFCGDGSLTSDRYKENMAVICECCGTPAAQLWEQ